jgi:hypothetical protein
MGESPDQSEKLTGPGLRHLQPSSQTVYRREDTMPLQNRVTPWGEIVALPERVEFWVCDWGVEDPRLEVLCERDDIDQWSAADHATYAVFEAECAACCGIKRRGAGEPARTACPAGHRR